MPIFMFGPFGVVVGLASSPGVVVDFGFNPPFHHLWRGVVVGLGCLTPLVPLWCGGFRVI